MTILTDDFSVWLLTLMLDDGLVLSSTTASFSFFLELAY